MLLLLNPPELNCPGRAALYTEGGLFFIINFTRQVARGQMEKQNLGQKSSQFDYTRSNLMGSN